MSTSRYSAKAQKRERQALFSTDDISRSNSGSPMPIIDSNFSNNDNVNSTMTSNIDVNNGTNVNINIENPYARTNTSSYSARHAEMAMLESQSEDTMNEMKFKISALKDLSFSMNDQINKSKRSIVELSEDMGLSSEKIKWNMGRMRRFVEQSGVGWKVWLGFSIIILWWFIWVWLF